MRVNINMDEELLKAVDEQANKIHVSRSAYIAFACTQKIQNDKMLESMPDMLRAFQMAAELKKAQENMSAVIGKSITAKDDSTTLK